MNALLLAIAVLLLAVGCAPSMKGAFDKGGYTSSYGYSIPYLERTQVLLPRGWVLDNFIKVKGDLQPKNSDFYISTHFLDDDNDGDADRDLSNYTYALRYEHQIRSGAIWLREIPIPGHQRHKDLRILMQQYVGQMVGANYELVTFGNVAVIDVQRFAATIVQQGPLMVAGRPGFYAIVDISNVDQASVSRGAPSRRIEVVMLRSPKDEEVALHGGQGKTRRYPVLLVAGYSNLPEDFDPDQDAFHELLSKITIDGKAGLTLGPTPQGPPEGLPVDAQVPAASGPWNAPAGSPAPSAPGSPSGLDPVVAPAPPPGAR